ncbi:MAG: LysR family transcriptional regulator [Pseudomonadota bacterium]|nr:LysR family transcriptional regulator [Pseudomonadota bacterium]
MSISRKIRLAAVFTAVADEGGFRAAGRKLDLSPAQVSQGVTDLEAELGTALFYRSTRKLQLTQAAEAVLPHFRNMMDSFDRGVSLLATSDPTEIRLSIPTALVTSFFAKALSDWQAENIQTRVLLDVSDGHHLRADTNADLFIRIGGPEDDMRIARLLCEVTGFLAMRKGAFTAAKSADDLKRLPLAMPMGLKRGFLWTHKKSEEQVMLGPSAIFTVNNTQMLRELMLAGHVVSPVFDFEQETFDDRLEIVNAAPDWFAGTLPVRAVYASDRPVLSPAKSLIEFLGQRLASSLKQTF